MVSTTYGKINDEWKEYFSDILGSTAVHVLNKSHLTPNSDKTPYKLWFGIPASIKHFKVFGIKCYIKNNDEHLGKYDGKADEGMFLDMMQTVKDTLVIIWGLINWLIVLTLKSMKESM